MRSGGEELSDERDGREDLLEVVQDEQKLSVPHVLLQEVFERHVPALPQAERARDLRIEEVGIGYGSEGHEEDAVLEVLQHVGGGLQGEPGLARTSRPRQREQAYLFLSQPPADLPSLPLPSDERSGL